MTAGVQDMPRELSKRKENAQVNNNPRPKPSRQLKVQPKQKKSAPPPNVPRLEVRTTQGVVYLTRAEGEAGRPHLNYARMCIAYTCECGGLIYIPVHYLSGDTDEKERAHGVARCIVDHKKHSRHKKAMESQEATFAESLSRTAEKKVTAPDERRRALVNRPRAAPSGSVQAPLSQLVTPSTNGGSALPTDAGRSFIGGGGVGETPAALPQALPTTDGNYTMDLPGQPSQCDAGRCIDIVSLRGRVLYNPPLGFGTSAVVYASARRKPRDGVYVLDGQIESASYLRKGPLIALRSEACKLVGISVLEPKASA